MLFSRIFFRDLSIARRQKGSTLIEILLYAALIGLIMGSVVLLTSVMFQARAKARSALILDQNMRFVMQRIISRVHAATQVTIPVSGTSTTLTLSLADATKNPTTITVTSGTVMFVEGTQPNLHLTSDEIQVTSLIFTLINGPPAGVRIQLSGKMRNGATSSQANLSLANTAFLRR